MNYIVVNGPPTSGKDTFCEDCIRILEARGYWGEIISSVALVKDIAYKCGWRGDKTPKNRKFLSDLKDLLTEWDDVPMKDILAKAVHFNDKAKAVGARGTIIFVMIREPEEIEKFVKETNAMTVFIDRAGTEAQINHADNCVYDYNYDLYVDNNGTLSDLNDAAVALCDSLLTKS